MEGETTADRVGRGPSWVSLDFSWGETGKAEETSNVGAYCCRGSILQCRVMSFDLSFLLSCSILRILLESSGEDWVVEVLDDEVSTLVSGAHKG